MATKTKKIKRAASKAATLKKRLTKAQKLKREIAKRNRLFAAADPAEKRVLIAKDVIEQIRLKRFRARAQTWVRPNVKANGLNHNPDLILEFGPDAPVRELFLNKQIQSCDCCALGAMFMSCTLYNNNQTAENFEEETDWDFDERIGNKRLGFSNGLNTFFSGAQMRLIESAFEGSNGAFMAPEREYNKVTAWMDKIPDDEKRLVAIMENIIENKGTFKP